MVKLSILCLLLTFPLSASPLSDDIARAAARVDAVVGVAAIDLETGRTVAVRGNESFPMGSVFKFPLAIEVLRRVDAGRLDLDRVYRIAPSEFSLGHSPIRDSAHGKPVALTLRALVAAAVANSDNTAGDYLLHLVTPRAVTETMGRLQAGGIRVDRTEKEIILTFDSPGGVARYAVDGRDTATPLAAAALIGAFHRRQCGLNPASQQFLTEILGRRSRNPVRIAKRLPKAASVIHKTGTMPGTLNDVGLITSEDGKHHIALAIFTKASRRSSEIDREDVVADIARMIYVAWAR